MLLNKEKYILSIFVSLLVCMSSCGGRPSNVLSEQKMVDLMVDMEIAESYETTYGNTTSDQRIELGKRVLKAHGVSEETLDTTLAWYGRNMDDYVELFKKVDKELEKRQKKYTEIPGVKKEEANDLWPYQSHLVISPLSGYDGLYFSFPIADIAKGSNMEFSFFLPNASSLKGTFGVIYEDGNGETSVTNFSSKNKIKMSLQTDTAKQVKRIFGSMQLKDISGLPLYIDSITLKPEPTDTIDYMSKRRGLKKFGYIDRDLSLLSKNDSTETIKKDTIADTEDKATLVEKKPVETHKELPAEKPEIQALPQRPEKPIKRERPNGIERPQRPQRNDKFDKSRKNI